MAVWSRLLRYYGVSSPIAERCPYDMGIDALPRFDTRRCWHGDCRKL